MSFYFILRKMSPTKAVLARGLKNVFPIRDTIEIIPRIIFRRTDLFFGMWGMGNQLTLRKASSALFRLRRSRGFRRWVVLVS